MYMGDLSVLLRANKEEPVEYWGNLGVLSGLYGKAKESCAVSFSRMAEWIIQNQEKAKKDALYLLFPIIRRVIESCPDEVITDPEAFYNYVAEYDRYYKEYYDKLSALHKIDRDAQFCYDIIKEIKEIIKNDK